MLDMDGLSFVLLTNQETAILLLILLPFLLTYAITSIKAYLTLHSQANVKPPPSDPYTLPFLGNIIPFLWNCPQYFTQLRLKYGSAPVRIHMGPNEMTVPSHPRHFEQILRSPALNNKLTTLMALEKLCGTPARAIAFYRADDSGVGTLPAKGSSVVPEHRIFYLQHQTVVKHLTGQGLQTLNRHFIERFAVELEMSKVGSEDWTEMPDFYLFLRDKLFNATISAIFGDEILRLNPTLAEDYWAFEANAWRLLQGLPRWMAPGAYAAQERLLSDFKKWHIFANAHLDSKKETQAEDVEWEPVWGSKLMRARHAYAKKMPDLDADALAADDMGLMFGAIANANPTAAWFALEIFRDPSLLTLARAEVKNALHDLKDAPSPSNLNITSLCSSPLLQSIFAETLRLRGANLVTRTSETSAYMLDQWKIPARSMLALSSRTVAFDEEIWNTGTPDDSHPLDRFWAERFILYPDDPSSGPLKNPQPRKERLEKPEFTLKGLSGAWISFGGGASMCPGRHFAKQEVIGAFAILTGMFEIEFVTGKSWEPEVDLSKFLMGTMPIKGTVPFRIRRRARDDVI